MYAGLPDLGVHEAAEPVLAAELDWVSRGAVRRGRRMALHQALPGGLALRQRRVFRPEYLVTADQGGIDELA